MTIIDEIRSRARAHPSRPALLSDTPEGATQTLSYAELVGNFDACAKQLSAEGVRPGDRCGLQARQGRGFVELGLGILAAGGCLAPIPEDHRGPKDHRAPRVKTRRALGRISTSDVIELVIVLVALHHVVEGLKLG